ncbi:MAG: 50S ribosomal protein L25/general stress protein Ctc [Gammaproteobacteria bacterium]|nr:50S ribosomal protein L25/general stress protein Ctc [Gammaproteobacteria bacterium]
MAQKVDLIAEFREDSGKGASRRLRRAGKVPAIVYGAGRPPRAVTFDRDVLMHQMENEAFFSSVLNVKVGKNNRQCILKDLQMHPAKRMPLHLDLQRIVEDEAIRMTVPIHFLNEDAAPGVKMGGGSISHMITEIEVTCLPADLPEYLDIDVGELELDETLYLADLKLPAGVAVPELTEDNNPGVVSIHIVKAAPVEEELEGEALEGEESAEVPVVGEEEEPKGDDEGGD